MSYYKWTLSSDVPLVLELAGADGLGVTGSDPHVIVRRYKTSTGGALDNYYWNGTGFISTPTSSSMTEVDPINQAGVYSFVFSQSMIQSGTMYSVYYKHSSVPIGFYNEMHVFSLSGSEDVYNIYESAPG